MRQLAARKSGHHVELQADAPCLDFVVKGLFNETDVAAGTVHGVVQADAPGATQPL